MSNKKRTINQDAITSTIIAAIITAAFGLIGAIFQGTGTAIFTFLLSNNPQQTPAVPKPISPSAILITLLIVFIGLIILVFLTTVIIRRLSPTTHIHTSCQFEQLQKCIGKCIGANLGADADPPIEYLCLFLIRHLFPDEARILVYKNRDWDAYLLFNHKFDEHCTIEDQYDELSNSLRKKLLANDDKAKITLIPPLDKEKNKYFINFKPNWGLPTKVPTVYCFTFLQVVFENLPKSHDLCGIKKEFGSDVFPRKWITIKEWRKSSKSNLDVIDILEHNFRPVINWEESISK
jgi:hypothetical protein